MTIAVKPISNLNAFTVTAADGSYQKADYALYALDANGKITSQPLIYEGVIRDDPRIYQDPSTGQLYFRTTHHSRFLDYGYDPSTGKLVMQDYTGDQLTYYKGDAMDPRLPTKNPNDMDDARKAFIANGNINAYEVTLGGVTYDQLSVSRLLLILTLSRAEAIEESLVTEMNKLTENNAKLEALSEIADLAVKADYIDIRYTKINYLGKDITIEKFLRDLGIDVSGMLEAAKPNQADIELEWSTQKHAAFKAKYDSVPYLPYMDSLKTLLIQNSADPNTANDFWYLAGPHGAMMFSNSNDTITSIIHNACDQRTLHTQMGEEWLLMHGLIKQYAISFEELIKARIGESNYKACMDAYDNAAPTKADGCVLSQDLLEIAKTQQDSLNNLSQETMINIQSLISARDQAYLLGSNGLKLLQNGNIMVARNI